MGGNPRHRHIMAFGQGNTEECRPLLGIVFEHLIEIAQTKEQQSIVLEALPGLPVLFHHGGFRAHQSKRIGNPQAGNSSSE